MTVICLLTIAGVLALIGHTIETQLTRIADALEKRNEDKPPRTL